MQSQGRVLQEMARSPDWSQYNFEVRQISASTYWGLFDLQANQPSEGGLGQFSTLTTVSSLWVELLQSGLRTTTEIPYIDCYAEIAVTDEEPNKRPGRLSLMPKKKAIREPTQRRSQDSARSRKSDDSPTKVPEDQRGRATTRTARSLSADFGLGFVSPAIVTSVCFKKCRMLQPLFDEVPWNVVIPHQNLLMVEIQLQQAARSGGIFHVLLWIEDHKAVDSHLTLTDQWSYHVDGVTSGPHWVAQAQEGFHRMVHGSKHVADEPEHDFRLWRIVWRRRPAPKDRTHAMLFEYLVAPRPYMENWRGRLQQDMAAAEAGGADDKVARDCDVFTSGAEAILHVCECRDMIICHELSCIRILHASTRQVSRVLPLSAKRIKVHGFQLFVVLSDEPPRIMIYDVVNENRAPIVLCPPSVIPTEVLVRPVGSLEQLWLLAVGPDQLVHIWTIPREVSSSKNEFPPSQSLEGHTDHVTCVEVGDEWIYSGSCDTTICCWEPSTGTLLNTMTGHDDWIFSIIYLKREAQLLSCSRDASVRLWSAFGDQCLKVVEMGGVRALTSLRLTPPVVGITLGNHRVALVDVATGTRTAICRGHGGRITQMLPYRQFLITSSVDRTVRIWELSTGQCLVVLRGHGDSVNGMCIVGDTLYTASDDGSLFQWQLSSLTLPGGGGGGGGTLGSAAGKKLARISLLSPRSAGKTGSFSGEEDAPQKDLSVSPRHASMDSVPPFSSTSKLKLSFTKQGSSGKSHHSPDDPQASGNRSPRRGGGGGVML